MLESHAYHRDGREGRFFTQVRETEDLPSVLQFWMAHAARDLLRLGVFFRAAALMCQIPGGSRYRYIAHDDHDDDLPDDDEDPRHWIGRADRDTAFSVLADCLRRLGAAGVMKEVPGGEDYEQVELSPEWKEYLDRRAERKCGLLNVIAECLDELVVGPEMAEIDVEPYPTWWQRWWSRME
ncbi:MAG: hypothetical protein FVQ82_15595 [Planctomycetes bacterium]|nr:hypothetical protein [Planctomycetota bacterium]